MTIADDNPQVTADNPQPPKPFRFADIFAKTNRGMLLDIFVFLLNLFLIRILVKSFITLADEAGNGDFVAEVMMFLFCVGIFVLPATGAICRRWHFHHRLQMQGKTMNEDEFAFGCLFNPIVFYCLNIIIFVGITVFVQQYFYGDEKPSAAFMGSTTLLGIIVPAVQTFLVYRYFSPPKKDPSAFFRSPLSEHLGDVCIFINMIFFQLAWNWLLFSELGFPHVSSVSEFFSRFVFLIILALFVYFPPRVFYLAEDISRRRAWLTILLANSPIIFHVVIGTSSKAGW